MNEWVSVETRLPPKGELVLISCEVWYSDGSTPEVMHHTCVGSFDINDDEAWRIGNEFLSWDFDFNYDCEVTHWMSLPDAPR